MFDSNAVVKEKEGSDDMPGQSGCFGVQSSDSILGQAPGLNPSAAGFQTSAPVPAQSFALRAYQMQVGGYARQPPTLQHAPVPAQSSNLNPNAAGSRPVSRIEELIEYYEERYSFMYVNNKRKRPFNSKDIFKILAKWRLKSMEELLHKMYKKITSDANDQSSAETEWLLIQMYNNIQCYEITEELMYEMRTSINDIDLWSMDDSNPLKLFLALYRNTMSIHIPCIDDND